MKSYETHFPQYARHHSFEHLRRDAGPPAYTAPGLRAPDNAPYDAQIRHGVTARTSLAVRRPSQLWRRCHRSPAAETYTTGTEGIGAGDRRDCTDAGGGGSTARASGLQAPAAKRAAWRDFRSLSLRIRDWRSTHIIIRAAPSTTPNKKEIITTVAIMITNGSITEVYGKGRGNSGLVTARTIVERHESSQTAAKNAELQDSREPPPDAERKTNTSKDKQGSTMMYGRRWETKWR